MKHTSFLAIPRPASGHYDLDQDIGDGTPAWDAIRQRLFDTSPVNLHKSEFCNSILRSIWTCIYDDPFLIEQRAGVAIFDDRDYVRPLRHILLDLVLLAQTKLEKSHRLIRMILGSDNLSDRFIGAANTCCLLIENVPLEEAA